MSSEPLTLRSGKRVNEGNETSSSSTPTITEPMTTASTDATAIPSQASTSHQATGDVDLMQELQNLGMSITENIPNGLRPIWKIINSMPVTNTWFEENLGTFEVHDQHSFFEALEKANGNADLESRIKKRLATCATQLTGMYHAHQAHRPHRYLTPIEKPTHMSREGKMEASAASEAKDEEVVFVSESGRDQMKTMELQQKFWAAAAKRKDHMEIMEYLQSAPSRHIPSPVKTDKLLIDFMSEAFGIKFPFMFDRMDKLETMKKRLEGFEKRQCVKMVGKMSEILDKNKTEWTVVFNYLLITKLDYRNKYLLKPIERICSNHLSSAADEEAAMEWISHYALTYGDNYKACKEVISVEDLVDLWYRSTPTSHRLWSQVTVIHSRLRDACVEVFSRDGPSWEEALTAPIKLWKELIKAMGHMENVPSSASKVHHTVFRTMEDLTSFSQNAVGKGFTNRTSSQKFFALVGALAAFQPHEISHLDRGVREDGTCPCGGTHLPANCNIKARYLQAHKIANLLLHGDQRSTRSGSQGNGKRASE